MTSERWQQVDEIFQAAIELKAEERPAFVERACAGDEELRREVESLITADEQGLSFVDEPAFQLAAGLLATGEPELAEGQTLGHYEVAGLIGRGGMGEVYLAKDKLLNRRIALKLLPADYTRNKDRLRRFQQEAQAASALNHPNILTIYELGQVNGQQFMATEFVEGETLRQLMKRGGQSVGEALDITIQIAGALSAAHRAGIIHRDIKPENIMLRPDGYVKVLDFGLAKLTQQEERTPKPIETDKTETSSGLVMGTVKYMSPEQARGQSVDLRSDIFSLGVVLYEMVTGHAPFKGEDASHLVGSILKDEPGPLTQYAPDAPEELQRIVSKALSKDKARRYRTAEDLLDDLKTLRQQMELGPASQTIVQKADSRATSTEALERGTTVSIEYVVSRILQHKVGATLTLAAFVIVIGGITFGFYKLTGLKKAVLPFQQVKVTRLTTFGHASMPVISPDGKYVFYGKEDGKQLSLWLRQIGATNELQIVPPTEANYGGGVFSADGKYVYYSISPISQNTTFNFPVYQIPISGGTARKLPISAAAAVSVSPDGQRLAYMHVDLSRKETELLTANADGTNERVILKRQGPGGLYYTVIPSWSPKGTSIAFAVRSADDRALVAEVDVLSGTERAISSHKWNQVGGVVWLPDMSALIVVAGDESASTRQIWQLSYPSGEAQRLTNDIGSYHSISVSSDGKALITEVVENQSSIWTVPVDTNNYFLIDLGLAKQVSVNRFDGRPGLSFTPDGRIVYAVEGNGNIEIWIMDADGENRKQLTTSHIARRPAVSPNGNYIVFESDRTGDGVHIWRMDIDGGTPTQLTTGQADAFPAFSPDGQWVVYESWESKQPTIWRVSIEGGVPAQITTTPSHSPVFSPDGKLIAYGYFGEKSQPRITVIPSEGGQPIKTFDLPRAYRTLRWTPDGRALAYLISLRNDVGNIWAQPIEGGPPRQLTDFTTDGLWNNAWSFDGKQLAFARGEQTRDVVQLTDLQ
jgi:eukaryotic-like serine/threonine-protein kinase